MPELPPVTIAVFPSSPFIAPPGSLVFVARRCLASRDGVTSSSGVDPVTGRNDVSRRRLRSCPSRSTAGFDSRVTNRTLARRNGMDMLRFGRQVCGSLDEAATREWLVTDGLGGFAMGTVAGLRTRRYHGLLVVATEPPIGRRLGLAALDAVLVVGDARIRLATHEWASGAVIPAGFEHLQRFDLIDGVPRWRWSVGPIALEAELAMAQGTSAVGVQWRLVSAGATDAMRLEVEALCTWRDVHGERTAAGEPDVERTTDG